MRSLFLFAISLCALFEPTITVAVTDDTMTGVFNDRFRSLQIQVAENPLAPPIINLGAGDRVIISFDELAEDRHYLRYSLTHCNADWRPSQLVELEYLDGFNQGDVTDYEFSRATTVHYVHYSITLPNEQMRFTVSGNYLLKVWDEERPDEILLQARFMVNEGGADVAGDVTSRTDIDYNKAHQQLSVVVDAERAFVSDPFNDLIVSVSQDGRSDNNIVMRQPLRASGKRAYYEHQRQLIFPAGNEYRRFETVSTSFPGMGVDEISYYEPYYHFKLVTDSPRSDGSYNYDQTQFGRYTIREYNSANSDTEADYVVTHFTLDMPHRTDVDIFLDGDFTSRRFDPESRMVFNRATGLYERSMLLKQGAYNYQYLAVPAGGTVGYTAPVEGDYFPTVNEYVVTVYHRAPASRYDRLIGATVIYSGR